MIAASATSRPEPAGTPASVRLLIALGLPFIGAMSVLSIWLGNEVILLAFWGMLFMIGFLLARPVAGIVMLTTGLLLAAYPTVLQSLGVLTVGNLLGVGMAALLAAHVLATRDLSFLRTPQLLVLGLIGVLLLLGSMYAEVAFPLLEYSRGYGIRMLDRTSVMLNDFFTRLSLLLFICVFVRTRGDIRAVFWTFVIVLFAAVPSALINWWQGELFKGFRIQASFTSGANANRLAMICLMQVACWWYWAASRPGALRRIVSYTAIGASLLVVFATGSRSALLGTGFLVLLLRTGPRRFRVPVVPLGALAVFGALAIATVTPPEAWQRMLRFSAQDPHAPGTSSIIQRQDTLDVGMRMFRDHPLFGVGIGNFKEVSRQVYKNEYFRPPHNSYLWAAAEGGILVLLSYGALFALTWRDLRRIMQRAAADDEVAHLAAALRVVFLIFFFFSFFADIWLNPITYVLIGLVATMRRHVDGVPVAVRTLVKQPQAALVLG
jgi:O-antigen ligase